MTQLSASEVPGGFTEKTAQVNGVRLNYVIGGTGAAVVLLHGYPQTWYMWRKVMPALAGQYTVIAPDLRGSGGSDAPATGYDKASLAEDVHHLLVALGHADQVSVVGHDIGGVVSYAYAAAHPDSVRRLTVIEAPQFDESLYQFPSATPAGPGLWNFGFFILDNGLPERIVTGREDTWIAGFVDWLEVVKGAVDGDAVAEYTAHLRRPGHSEYRKEETRSTGTVSWPSLRQSRGTPERPSSPRPSRQRRGKKGNATSVRTMFSCPRRSSAMGSKRGARNCERRSRSVASWDRSMLRQSPFAS